MRNSNIVGRREFLDTAGAITIAASLARGLFAADERQGDMIYRKLGKTGERVSAMGLGGYHIGEAPSEQDAIRLVRSAIDRGMTFMDNSWDYMDGKCETWMGKALRDGYRQKVFLMTKFDGRTRASTARQIEDSLTRLETDHVDLMQFHENIRLEDPDRFFNDGPVEALLDAKKAGKIRYIGFTGHKDPLVHLRMLEVAQAHNFQFDAAQMPLGPLDANFRSFARQAVPKLVERGVAVLAMKTMAGGGVPAAKLATPIECLHYALNLPTSVVITGIPDQKTLDQAFEAVRTFQPLSQGQLSALLSKTRDAALSGKYEYFKTTPRADGTALNPSWMG
ncbi:MAG: aldo/keto reductase [Bryobacteraceae bacterium]|jgi:aryl-alcohol dehydrogenase-like predicted oxidoreductase